MEFSSQEYWNGFPFPSPGNLPDPGIEPRSSALQADSLPSAPPGKPKTIEYLLTVLWGETQMRCCNLSEAYIVCLLSFSNIGDGSSVNYIKFNFAVYEEITTSKNMLEKN